MHLCYATCRYEDISFDHWWNSDTKTFMNISSPSNNNELRARVLISIRSRKDQGSFLWSKRREGCEEQVVARRFRQFEPLCVLVHAFDNDNRTISCQREVVFLPNTILSLHRVISREGALSNASVFLQSPMVVFRSSEESGTFWTFESIFA